MSDHLENDQENQGGPEITRRELGGRLAKAGMIGGAAATLLWSSDAAAAAPEARQPLLERVVNTYFVKEQLIGSPDYFLNVIDNPTGVISGTPDKGGKRFATKAAHEGWLFTDSTSLKSKDKDALEQPVGSGKGDGKPTTSGERSAWEKIIDKLDNSSNPNGKWHALYNRSTINPSDPDHLLDIYTVLQSKIEYELDQNVLYGVARFVKKVGPTTMVADPYVVGNPQEQLQNIAYKFLDAYYSEYYTNTLNPNFTFGGGILVLPGQTKMSVAQFRQFVAAVSDNRPRPAEGESWY